MFIARTADKIGGAPAIHAPTDRFINGSTKNNNPIGLGIKFAIPALRTEAPSILTGE